jgi:hypothetical protein
MNRKHALILLGIATVAFTVAGALPTPVRGAAHPSILAFEFAGSEARAAQIMPNGGRVDATQHGTCDRQRLDQLVARR